MRRLLILFAFTLFIGCKGGVDKTLEEVIDENYPLAVGGILHVRSEDGSIRFFGSDASELHVKAIKRAYSSERLRALGMRVTSQVDSISIETTSLPKRKWSLHDRSGTIDYIITMPQHMKTIDAELINGEISVDGLREGSVEARLTNGRVSARNCFANFDCNVSSGAIDFYYNWWEAGDYLVKAAIPNGSIGLFLPRTASFQVEAETQGGGIMGNLIDEDETMPRHRKRLSTKIGVEAGPRFQFRTVKGNIRLHGY